MDSPPSSSSALGVSTVDGEELTYDKDLRLGGGRNGSVFQGSLNKNVVAVKVLSSEASSDVRIIPSIPSHTNDHLHCRLSSTAFIRGEV